MNFTRRRFLRRLLGSALVLLFAVSTGSAAIDPRWQPRVDRYLNFDRTNPPRHGAVVFAGSSSIDMWRTLQADFPDIPVVNRGIGGTGIFDWPDLATKLVYPLRPRTIVFYAGENDLQVGRTADEVVADFEKLRDQIRREAPQANLVFLALKPSPSRLGLLGAMRDANARIAQLCAEDPACTFVDVFTPMLDQQGEPRAEIFIADRLHMNAEGYKLWRQLVAPVLKPGK